MYRTADAFAGVRRRLASLCIPKKISEATVSPEGSACLAFLLFSMVRFLSA